MTEEQAAQLIELLRANLETAQRTEAKVDRLGEFVDEAGEQISKIAEGGIGSMISGLMGG